MKFTTYIFLTLIVIAFLNGCKSSAYKFDENRANDGNAISNDLKEINKENYELIAPNKRIKKVLILFPGYPENAEAIKREFNILEQIRENQIAVIYMNFNQKLWLEESEKQTLAEQLQNIFLENKLPLKDIYFGGFSSGGNVSLLITSYFLENLQYNIKPKGVFIVDSPIDLVGLYTSSEKNIANNFSEVSIQESTWIIETLGKNFGNPHKDVSKYNQYAVFTSQNNNANNLKNLRDTKIRLFTEPDTLWWKENRKADYDQMNAYFIKKLYENLKASGFKQVEYIPTENKGYRANGDRHPHSWSIVDKNELMKWMMN